VNQVLDLFNSPLWVHMIISLLRLALSTRADDAISVCIRIFVRMIIYPRESDSITTCSCVHYSFLVRFRNLRM